ncbi:MAG TPA: nuclear transport factor 2 family protein [Pyrinomonadaceae bacterium]|nr:nuclear transport factor 2 family protein [Pyrinomonadaceae bacterium]
MPNGPAAEPHTRIETEQLLRQMNDEWVKALVRGDAETLNRIMADDFFFAYPFEGDDKNQFISDVTEGNVQVELITRENTAVRIWGDTAVLAGKDSAKWFYRGRDFSGHYKVLHVFSRRDERWQLVALQACPVP